MDRMRRLIAPPIFEDDDKTRSARLLNLILLTTIPVLVIRVAIIFFTSPETRSGLWVSAAVVVLQFVLLFLIRRGFVLFAGSLLCLAVWVAVSYGIYVGGGLSNPNFTAYGPIIMLAGLLLGASAAIGFGVLVILSGLALAYLGAINQLPIPNPPITTTYVVTAYSVNFAITAVLLAIAAYSIKEALEKARRSSHALAERNQELQREIAERELTEKALRQSEERFSKAFNVSPAPLSISTTEDGRFIDANHSLAELLGYRREELIDHTAVELNTWAEPDQRERTMEMLWKDGAVRQQEIPFRTKSGDIRPTLTSLELIEVGNETYVLGMLLDITERKLAEAHRMELTVAREKMTLLTEVIGNLSHDLKTPLSVIETSLYLIERLSDPEKQKDKLEVIKEQTRYLERTIQDILTIARLEHVPQLTRKPVDLNELVQDVEKMLYPSVEKKNLATSMALSEELPPIFADESELHRVVMNLVENAVKYTPEGGRITVRTFSEDVNAVLEVSDTGIGISEQDLPHIFDRFYRTEGARSSKIGGTGLGLAITKKIVDMLGGDIEVESMPGTGSTFRVRLSLSE